MDWNRVVSALCVVALFLGGCGVTSVHPLSDEKTSLLDERLVGVWEGVPSEEKQESGQEREQQRLYVGRHAERKNTLEAVYVQLEEEQVKVQRFDLFTTKLGALHYASGGRRGLGFLILLYELGEPDRVTVRSLKEDVVAAAIEKGLLDGEITREKSKGLVEVEVKNVRITASPEKIAAWLKDYSPACFEAEEPAVLRRIRLEK